MKYKYMMIAYKLDNGFIRETKMLDYSNQLERLEGCKDCKKYKEMESNGWIINIVEVVL